MYRRSSSLVHSDFVPQEDALNPASHMSPNGYFWPTFPLARDGDWTQQKLVASNGSPASKHGLSIWAFSISKDMEANTCFASLDGDALIIVQSGAIDVQTELGELPALLVHKDC